MYLVTNTFPLRKAEVWTSHELDVELVKFVGYKYLRKLCPKAIRQPKAQMNAYLSESLRGKSVWNSYGVPLNLQSQTGHSSSYALLKYIYTCANDCIFSETLPLIL